jgi:protein TonB
MTASFFRAAVLMAMVFAGAPAHGADKSWQTTTDYPAKALREHREGTTYFTVTVGTDGRAKDCVVTKSSGSTDLDKAACKIIVKRARFNPATDDQGKPIEKPYSNSVNWKIP